MRSLFEPRWLFDPWYWLGGALHGGKRRTMARLYVAFAGDDQHGWARYVFGAVLRHPASHPEGER